MHFHVLLDEPSLKCVFMTNFNSFRISAAVFSFYTFAVNIVPFEILLLESIRLSFSSL